MTHKVEISKEGGPCRKKVRAHVIKQQHVVLYIKWNEDVKYKEIMQKKVGLKGG